MLGANVLPAKMAGFVRREIDRTLHSGAQARVGSSRALDASEPSGQPHHDGERAKPPKHGNGRRDYCDRASRRDRGRGSDRTGDEPSGRGAEKYGEYAEAEYDRRDRPYALPPSRHCAVGRPLPNPRHAGEPQAQEVIGEDKREHRLKYRHGAGCQAGVVASLHPDRPGVTRFVNRHLLFGDR